MTGTDIIGYLRDLIMAGFGLAILFGADFTDDQVAGIVLFVTTLVTFATYLWTRYKTGNGTAAGK